MKINFLCQLINVQILLCAYQSMGKKHSFTATIGIQNIKILDVANCMWFYIFVSIKIVVKCFMF